MMCFRSISTIAAVTLWILCCCYPTEALSQHHHNGGKGNIVNRRDLLIGGSAAMVGGTSFFLPVSVASAESGGAGEGVAPVAVIGASGRTGALCVASCIRRGLPVRALTRTGTWPPPTMDGLLDTVQMIDDAKGGGLLTVVSCDVKDPVALAAGVDGCRGVIYAASASKKGGNPKEIDNLGVVATGDACLKANVGRYVVISSTAVTRPSSLGYKFTDITVGGIMGEKRKGEDGVRAAFNVASSSTTSPSYSILRPGGLEEPKKNIILGPGALEVSQGDVLAGIVSRADLAEVAVELALSNAPNLKNAALELYYTDSAQPCEGKFKPLLNNGEVQRLHGDSYEALFRGIQPDGAYYVPAPN